jgi:hypothetical protein
LSLANLVFGLAKVCIGLPIFLCAKMVDQFDWDTTTKMKEQDK